MRTLETLIDEASDFCHGDRKLCEKTGLHPSQLSDMRAGRKPISPETVGLLCDVLELDGEEARRLLAMAVVTNPKNKARALVLRRAFFVSWALGVAFATTPSDADSRELSMTLRHMQFTLYTLCREVMAWACQCLGFAWRGHQGVHSNSAAAEVPICGL